MTTYLPYIVSILCSAIAGFTSYAVARKQAKADLQKLEKQHELDLKRERELFAMKKETMEIEHQHQLDLLQRRMENELGTSVTSSLISEVMKVPEVRQKFTQGIIKGNKKHK